MTFERVSFVSTSWKGKTLKDFLGHEKHHGLTEDQLKEAWKLIEAENNPQRIPAPAVSEASTEAESEKGTGSKKNQPVDTGSADKKA